MEVDSASLANTSASSPDTSFNKSASFSWSALDSPILDVSFSSFLRLICFNFLRFSTERKIDKRRRRRTWKYQPSLCTHHPATGYSRCENWWRRRGNHLFLSSQIVQIWCKHERVEGEGCRWHQDSSSSWEQHVPHPYAKVICYLFLTLNLV